MYTWMGKPQTSIIANVIETHLISRQSSATKSWDWGGHSRSNPLSAQYIKTTDHRLGLSTFPMSAHSLEARSFTSSWENRWTLRIRKVQTYYRRPTRHDGWIHSVSSHRAMENWPYRWPAKIFSSEYTKRESMWHYHKTYLENESVVFGLAKSRSRFASTRHPIHARTQTSDVLHLSLRHK